MLPLRVIHPVGKEGLRVILDQDGDDGPQLYFLVDRRGLRMRRLEEAEIPRVSELIDLVNGWKGTPEIMDELRNGRG